MNRNWAKSMLCAVLGSIVIVGCAVDADGDPDVVTTPGSSTTVIKEDRTPDVNITTPAPAPTTKTEVNIDPTSPASTTTTTTGG